VVKNPKTANRVAQNTLPNKIVGHASAVAFNKVDTFIDSGEPIIGVPRIVDPTYQAA